MPGYRATDYSRIIFITWKMLRLKALFPTRGCDLHPAFPYEIYGFRESLLLKADSCLEVTKTHQVAKVAVLNTMLRTWECWSEFTNVGVDYSLVSFRNPFAGKRLFDFFF